MRLLDLLEETLKLPTSDLISPVAMENIVDRWSEAYGDNERGHYWASEYVYSVNQLHEKGGYVFRLVFLNSPDDLNAGVLGNDWTTDESQIVDYIDKFRDAHNADGGKSAYVITAKIKPRSISVPADVVAGEPTEWEVNLTSYSAIINYKLHRY